MNDIKNDSSGKAYVEVPTAGGEHVRVTLVPADDGGYGQDSVRVQIRDAKGHLRQGPELPVACIGDLVGALVAVVIEGAQHG